MSRDETLKMAVIGCGFIGELHARAIADSPQAELTAVCDVDSRRAELLAGQLQAKPYTDWHQLLAEEELHAVTIATPDNLHVDPALASIAQGLDLFCEKPLAPTHAECQRIVRAAADRGVQLGVDYNRRFAFGYQTARRLQLDAGMIIKRAVMDVVDGVPQAVARQPYALFTSLLTHHLDLLRWFCGEISAVQAITQGPTDQQPHHVAMLLELQKGGIASLNASWRAGQSRTVEQLQLLGEEQVLLVEDAVREVTVWRQTPDELQQLRPDTFQSGTRFFDSVAGHVSAFIQAVAAGRDVPVTAIDAAASLQLVEAAIESSRSGRRTPITA